MRLYSKDAHNILATFEHVLKETYDIELKEYFIVADRAGENPKAFGRRYIICWGHALDLAFKFAKKRYSKKFDATALETSWKAMHDLTSYCK